jgi:iron complex transport system substrate-binding protein
MIRRHLLLLALLVSCLACASCDRREPRKNNIIAPPKYPKRIVSLAPSVTETLFALGLDKEIVGVTQYCKYPPAARKIKKVGGLYDLNYEAVVELQPDLVILSGLFSGGADELEKLGLKTLIVPYNTVGDVLDSTIKIGRAVGRTKEAEILAKSIKKEIDSARAKRRVGKPPRVLIVVDRTPGSMQGFFVVGSNNFLDELLEIAGGKNIFGSAAVGYPQPSLEEIISRNPEIIIETRIGENLSDRDSKPIAEEWKTLGDIDAVKNGRVYIWTDYFLTVPGPRIGSIARNFRKVIDDR